MLGVPLMREGIPIGVFVLMRRAVQPFTDKQIELAETFADQAVIAIENVRLFEAERQRTRELTESLEQQTATSEVLSVISRSPANIQPVFEIIRERAEKLCDAERSLVSIVEGELIHLASIHGPVKAAEEAARRAFPMRLTDETVAARAIRTRSVCHVPDVLSDPQYQLKGVARVSGFRGALVVPMVRDDQVIGAIFVSKKQPGLFSDAQIQLLKTFADQAVIAIENVRLLRFLWSSRLLPPTSSRSSAVRPSICVQCCRHSLNQLPGSVLPTTPPLFAKKMVPSTVPRPTAIHVNS